jgi:hypothetical protein
MLLKIHSKRLEKFAVFLAFIGLVVWLFSPPFGAVASSEPTSNAVDFPVGIEPKSITSADFNNDGKRDLVTANRSSGNITILLGEGNGNFSAGSNFFVGGELFR